MGLGYQGRGCGHSSHALSPAAIQGSGKGLAAQLGQERAGLEGDPETVRTQAEVIKGASERVTSEKLEQKIRHHLLYLGNTTVNYLEV